MWGGGVKSRGAWWMLPSKPWVDCLGRRGGLSLHCSQNKGWKLLEHWTIWVNIEKKFPFSQNCSLKGLGLIVRWRILFHESICKTRVTMYQDSVQCRSETGEHTPRGLPVSPRVSDCWNLAVEKGSVAQGSYHFWRLSFCSLSYPIVSY